MANYIRFDWAMTRLLRQKANFGVIGGLLTSLLNKQARQRKPSLQVYKPNRLVCLFCVLCLFVVRYNLTNEQTSVILKKKFEKKWKIPLDFFGRCRTLWQRASNTLES